MDEKVNSKDKESEKSEKDPKEEFEENTSDSESPITGAVVGGKQ